MIPFTPAFSGVAAQAFAVTDTIAPLSGAALVGMLLTSLAGIVLTVLLDRWQSRRHAKPAAVSTVDTGTLSKAA